MQIGERTIDRVTVIGAGFIGLGWTVVFARAGLEVCVHDADAESLERLPSRVDGALASAVSGRLAERG